MGASSANSYPGYRGPPGKRNKQGLAWADANSLSFSGMKAPSLLTGLDGMGVPMPMATPLPNASRLPNASPTTPSVGPSCVLEAKTKPLRPSVTPPVMRPLKFLTTITTTGESVESDVVELEWRITNFMEQNPGVGVAIKGTPFNAGGHLWQLVLYPDGCDHEHAGVMGVFLKLLSERTQARASYQMFLLPAGQVSDAVPFAADGDDGDRPVCSRMHVQRYQGGNEEKGDQTWRCVQLGNDVYMPAAPAWASEHRGGPRNFENRIVGTKASWGFPSFLRRQRVFRDGFLSRAGLLTLRCTVAVHHCVVRVQA